MQLDSFTLLVTSCAALSFIGCAILYFWNRDRRSSWLLWWSVPFLLSGAGSLIYLRPGWDDDFISIAIGNAIRITAIAFFWAGARAFDRRPVIFWPLLAAPLLWCAACLFPPFLESMPARVLGVSAFNTLFTGLAAWELWRGRHGDELPSRFPAVIVFASFAVLMLVRILGAGTLPFPMGAAPLDPIWMGVFSFIVFIEATFLCLLIVSLTRERAEGEERNNALIDPLTGLMNRRAFMAQMDRMARRATHSRGVLAMLVLDLDKFKTVNDRYGHEVGDRVLSSFAGVAERSIRGTDLLYRMGGEEFCCILPDTSRSDAITVAERIRESFAASGVELPGDRGSVEATVSIGIAVTGFAGFDPELLLSAADAALYEAKARGRNRVVVADPSALTRTSDAIVAFNRRKRA